MYWRTVSLVLLICCILYRHNGDDAHSEGSFLSTFRNTVSKPYLVLKLSSWYNHPVDSAQHPKKIEEIRCSPITVTIYARAMWCCQNLVNVPRGIWWFGSPGRITWLRAALWTWQEFSMCTPLQLGLGNHRGRSPPYFRKIRHVDARSSGPLL